MSRFNNLEFDNRFEDHSHHRGAARDGAYYLEEAQGHFEAGKFEQALRSYAKVLEFDPKCAAAWVGQVRMLIELDEAQEAKLWADKALEAFPEEPELLAAKGVALARSGDTKEALLFSDAAIEARGNTPYIWLARGDVLMARREKRADYCFEKAFSLAPQNWLLHWLASRIHLFYKQASLALKFVQQALAFDAARAVLWLQAGRCQMALGLAVPAGNSFEQARQLDPSCGPSEAEATQLREGGFLSRLGGRLRQLFRS